MAHQVLVVGGGHNGLVAACYLSRAGVRVQVLEQSDRLGGGSRTEELIPGFRFNTHSAAHNILNATDIAGELHLHEVGLRCREMDPFSVAVFSDGRIVRFHRSVEATVDSPLAADALLFYGLYLYRQRHLQAQVGPVTPDTVGLTDLDRASQPDRQVPHHVQG